VREYWPGFVRAAKALILPSSLAPRIFCPIERFLCAIGAAVKSLCVNMFMQIHSHGSAARQRKETQADVWGYKMHAMMVNIRYKLGPYKVRGYWFGWRAGSREKERQIP
jgi:hypothetical protein